MMPIKTVMLIDDDADIRFIAELSLQRVGGWEVEVCNGGEAGLEALKVSRPDVILLDMMMPGLNGAAVIARIQAMPAHAATPVIFMTAKTQAHEITEYLSLGAVGIVSKPFDPIALPDLIREIIDADEAD